MISAGEQIRGQMAKQVEEGVAASGGGIKRGIS